MPRQSSSTAKLPKNVYSRQEMNDHLIRFHVVNGRFIDREAKSYLRHNGLTYSVWEPGAGNNGIAAYLGGSNRMADAIALALSAPRLPQQQRQTRFDSSPLSDSDLWQLTCYKWRYSLETHGFSSNEARHLIFLRWLRGERKIGGEIDGYTSDISERIANLLDAIENDPESVEWTAGR